MYISIDSRLVAKPQETIFFAFKGKNHNGHDYVKKMYEEGVRSFVVSEKREEYAALEGAKVFYVEDVLEALQNYAGRHRQAVKAEVIAITGSNGKTIVKEWLYQLLLDDYSVYRSPKSYNSQVGVPISLNGIEESAEIAIIEAGISEKGEMMRLERIIKPNIAIFTHFGDAHSENFSSEQEKLMEKAILFRYADVIIGREGKELDYILSIAGKDATHMVWGEGTKAGVKVEQVEKSKESRTVRITYKEHSFLLTIPFPDEASYENCMNAVCVLLLKGVAPERIMEKVLLLQPVAMRLEIKEGVNRSILIADYYNSDITSFGLALNTLVMQDETKKKVLILSDFVDIKSDPELLYREVADRVKQAGVEQFIGIGEELYRYRNLFAPDSKFYFDTDSFLAQENRNNYRDRVVLLKGARKYHFEYIENFLQRQSHNTLLEVDMDAMIHNLNYYRSLIPEETKVAIMLKAFAYGSGSGEIANLLQYHGADYFMVAFADEGIALRADGINIPIAVMNPEPDAFDSMIEFELEPEIYALDMLADFDQRLVKHGIENYPVHIKLNTGMNRSGINEGDMAELFDFFRVKRRVELRSVFTHLAAADEPSHDDFTREQIERFTAMSDEIQRHFDYKIMRHILNSAGIERFSESTFDMVRLGIGLHGFGSESAKLVPVSSFKTYIMSVREVKQTETVGYGRKGLLRRDSRIAVVPVGYADGLNRRLSNGAGQMFVRGTKVPVVGNICMDTCMLDVTDTDAQVGDEVEIFGKNIPVSGIAHTLGTIPYEVLTSVAYRVKRVYFKE